MELVHAEANRQVNQLTKFWEQNLIDDEGIEVEE
jgi:hypothetical protein